MIICFFLQKGVNMRTRKNILKISLGLTATTSLFGACYSLCANKSTSLKSISYNEITKNQLMRKNLEQIKAILILNIQTLVIVKSLTDIDLLPLKVLTSMVGNLYKMELNIQSQN